MKRKAEPVGKMSKNMRISCGRIFRFQGMGLMECGRIQLRRGYCGQLNGDRLLELMIAGCTGIRTVLSSEREMKNRDNLGITSPEARWSSAAGSGKTCNWNYVCPGFSSFSLTQLTVLDAF